MSSSQEYVEMKAMLSRGEEVCPVRYVLSIIGQRWKIPILWHLADERAPLRFSDLRRGIPGVSDVMLSKALRELTEDGLIVRKLYPCVPPRTEYTLSDRGRALTPVLCAIHEWGEAQIRLDRGGEGAQVVPDMSRGAPSADQT